MIGGNEFPLNSFGRAGRTCSTPQCNLWFLLGFLIHCILLGSIPIAFQIPPEVWCFRYVFVVEIPPHPGVLKPRVCNNRFSSRSWNPWKPSQPGSFFLVSPSGFPDSAQESLLPTSQQYRNRNRATAAAMSISQFLGK